MDDQRIDKLINDLNKNMANDVVKFIEGINATPFITDANKNKSTTAGIMTCYSRSISRFLTQSRAAGASEDELYTMLSFFLKQVCSNSSMNINKIAKQLKRK